MISIYIKSVLIWSIILYTIAFVFENEMKAIAIRSTKDIGEKARRMKGVESPIFMLKFSLLVSLIPVYRLIVAFTIIFYRYADD